MPGLLVEKGYLLTGNASDAEIPTGYILIEDDLITCVSGGEAPQEIRKKADEVIDATGQIVMPGLVNAHVHLQQSLVRGLADDREVWDWVSNVAFPIYSEMNNQEVYLSTMVGIIENIRSGATATTDNQTVRSRAGNFEAGFRAGRDSGIRYKLARGFNERGVPEQFIETPDGILDDMTGLFETWHDQENGRLRLDFNPHTLYLVTEETMLRVNEKALEWGIGVHLHTAESQDELSMFAEETGMHHVEWLADRECMPGRVFLAVSIDRLRFPARPNDLLRKEYPAIVGGAAYQREFLLSYLGSDALVSNVRKLWEKIIEDPASRFRYHMATGDAEYLWDRELEFPACPDGSISTDAVTIRQFVDYIRKIKELADSYGSGLTLIWNPIPKAEQIAHLQDARNLFQALSGVADDLYRLPVTDERLLDGRNFHDRGHFKPELGSAVIASDEHRVSLEQLTLELEQAAQLCH